jgi:hypothetical protein
MFHDQFPIYLLLQVVSAESAVLHLPNEIPIMMNGNHRSICRFSDSPADEKRYSIVWKNLKAIADELISTEVTHITSILAQFYPLILMNKEGQC